ncbi:sugar phosphate nucleotidyltransferase, partial [candidate division KSB1 bacterium]
IIDQSLESGIDEIAFIIGYKGNQIKEFVETSYSFNYTFYEQKEMFGLGYAVGLAEDFLIDEPVFIILGDTVFDVNIKPVFNSEFSTLGVKEVKDPRRFGTAELDKNGFITQLVEKPSEPRSNLVLVGLYYFKSGRILKEAIGDLISRGRKTEGEFQITDAIQIMIDNGEKVKTFNVEGWYDCGKPETILATNRYLLNTNNYERKIEGSLIQHPVHIDDTAEIENSIIGPYTTVARDAIIKNSILVNSIVGDNSIITDVSMKDSIIGSKSKVTGSFNTLNIGDFSEINL